MSSSPLKHLTYIAILFSVFVAYSNDKSSNDKCQIAFNLTQQNTEPQLSEETGFFKGFFDNSFRTLVKQYPEESIVKTLINQYKAEDEIFKKNAEDTSYAIISAFKNFSFHHLKEDRDSDWTQFLYLYADFPYFRAWVYHIQMFYEWSHNNFTNYLTFLWEFIKDETLQVPPRWENFLKIYEENLSFRKWVADFQNFILRLPSIAKKSEEEQDTIIENTLKQRKLNTVLNKDSDKEVLLSTFISIQTAINKLQENKNSLQIKFVQIYTNDISFREWFHKLQLLNLASNNLKIFKEELNKLKQTIQEKTNPSWSKFLQAYNKDISFQKLVDKFQNFILQSFDIKKETESQNVAIQNYEHNIEEIIDNQFNKEAEIFEIKKYIVEKFINIKNITNQSWVEFMKQYTERMKFRVWFQQLQILEAAENDKEALSEFSKQNLAELRTAIKQEAKVKKWNSFLQMYTDKKDTSFKIMVIHFQQFILDYKIN